MPRVRKLQAEEEQIGLSYRSGLTIRELAGFHGVSPGTIRNILRRNGEDLRKRGRRPKDN
jgi:DNA-directed RNA polymerase specialized sigma24 family protein